ncbi:hypothetical protein D0T84_07335 [Dysgonomonas sp. 521]|uniref:HEAT repeat domain-containing protein n=1 Tax=Dysgonomonas sp. 521 TaxID=2302932 RepID=UPI0013D2AA38|nr:HEAT repeat domain-containing protein [Dysgonomonas sp. 521]NDV94731.1 hypothetical protein [Dysgonomonas sp. 521]
MDNYLTDLISRLSDRSDWGIIKNSGDSISFKAHREAEKITDSGYIPQLIGYIEVEKKKERRDSAYFILGKIAKNLQDEKVAEFLINRIPEEKNENILSSMLDRLADLPKPACLDLTLLLDATRDKRRYVRWSAISALDNTNNPKAEDRLIEILQNPEDDYDLTRANATLSRIGSSKSLPHLEKLITYKIMDVAYSALNAMVEIADESYLPLFVKQLTKGKLKSVAIEGVVRYGREDVIPVVIKRIKELVAKQRKYQTIIHKGQTDLMVGMEFLVTYSKDYKYIRDLYNILTTKKSGLLFDIEKEWLESHSEMFI